MYGIGMRPIHPGEILSEEFLKPLGITTAALARSLNELRLKLATLWGSRAVSVLVWRRSYPCI
ncbi:plasmid maintenance system antidote protein VapI [Pseudomonas lini]|nr:plasmid maintenance system antidote protein VapI [Pseudomonas lini]